MSKTEFTEGPWAQFDHGVGELCVFNVATGGAICVLDDTDSGYAWPEGYSVSGEAKANANLIAAAPDLYEALEMALACCCHLDEVWLDDARAALAKARGELTQAAEV